MGTYTNEEINQPITDNEIIEAEHSLKRNKSPGSDGILNEHIKATLHIMLPTYVKLFNIVFDKGIVPESWLLGDIIPIYKNKGDVQNPENYRPITLLSCLGKLFTSIINTGPTKFTDEHNIITDSQTGFRKGYSTSNNLFVINCLIDILKSRSKNCFVLLLTLSRHSILYGVMVYGRA